MCSPDTSIMLIGADEAVRVRQGVYVRAMPIYRPPSLTIPMPPWAKPKNVRACIIRDIASAVSFCERAGVKLVVHPLLIHVSSSVVVCYVADAPDTRFDPPEGDYCPAWSIGCMLHKMITGRAPVTTRDVAEHREMRALVRCLGTPTLSESHALGIPPQERARARAKVPGASLAERMVLRATLAWDPARRMACVARGLVSALDTVWDGDTDLLLLLPPHPPTHPKETDERAAAEIPEETPDAP
jgi:hypothetical protein